MLSVACEQEVSGDRHPKCVTTHKGDFDENCNNRQPCKNQGDQEYVIEHGSPPFRAYAQLQRFVNRRQTSQIWTVFTLNLYILYHTIYGTLCDSRPNPFIRQSNTHDETNDDWPADRRHIGHRNAVANSFIFRSFNRSATQGLTPRNCKTRTISF
jgi:hypothetical protein